MAKSILDYTAEQVNTSVGNATKVRANQPLSGTEANLTALEVSGVNYKVPEGGGGGSDPILENAKTTNGIGWTEAGTGVSVTWDGDTTGKETISIGTGRTLCKVTSSVPKDCFYIYNSKCLCDYSGVTLSGTIDNADQAEKFDGEHEVYVVRPFSQNIFVVFAFEDCSIGEMNFTKGIWFETRTLESADNNVNESVGYITSFIYPSDVTDISWDGDTTGRVSFEDADGNKYFRISSTIPSNIKSIKKSAFRLFMEESGEVQTVDAIVNGEDWIQLDDEGKLYVNSSSMVYLAFESTTYEEIYIEKGVYSIKASSEDFCVYILKALFLNTPIEEYAHQFGSKYIPLYMHTYIFMDKISNEAVYLSIPIISSNKQGLDEGSGPEPFHIRNYCRRNGFCSADTMLACSGYMVSSSSDQIKGQVIGCYADGSKFMCVLNTKDDQGENYTCQYSLTQRYFSSVLSTQSLLFE